MDKNEREQYKQALAEVAKNNRAALAEMLVEYLDPVHVATDFVGMLLNTRNLKPGDQLIKKVRRGIVVRTLVPGAVHLASEVTVTDRANYNLAGFDVKVLANEWELESGELGTIGDIETEMRAKIKDYFLTQVFNALTNLWNGVNTPNNFVNVGGPLTAAVLRAAINEVNYRVGAVKAVVGTRRALTPITEFGNYLPYNAAPNVWGVGIPSNIEEINRTGFLGSWYGTKIIGLDQVWNNEVDYQAQLPEDKILVIGENVGEFITYGDVKSKSWTDMNPTPPVYITEMYGQYGMIVDHQIGVYVIGGLT